MAKRATPRETLTPKPTTAKSPSELATMQGNQLADQASAWDEARAALAAAVDAAATAQAALDGLASDASEDDRYVATFLLAECENAVRDAEARITKLSSLEASSAGTLPEGAAGSTEHGGNASAPPAPADAELGLAGGAVRPPATNTRESEEPGGSSDLAAPAAGPHHAIFPMSDGMREAIVQEALDQASGVINSIRDQIKAGDAEGALARLDGDVADAELVLTATTAVLQRLKAARIELGRTAICWPLEVIRYNGANQPIGEPLKIEPELLEQLLDQGVVSDTAPQH